MLETALQSELKPYKGRLGQAMRYSLLAGGKRFRPRLCFAVARTLGREPRKVLPIACAVEMIHTFTLIHDDLPAMDNSDYRRGKLSCHKKFDEATAILAGDALNTLAFTALAKNCQPPVSAEIAAALMKVVIGQVGDIESSGKKISLTKLKSIHQNKTAALLKGCVRAAAIQLNASPKQIAALTAYAGHLGLAFQITDDILDTTASQAQLGKPVKADTGKGFPNIIGLEKSRLLARQEQAKAIKALRIFGNRAAEFEEIVDFVVSRNS